ncbi:MAG: TSUP family transporter [Acetobacteraceae bacterium]
MTHALLLICAGLLAGVMNALAGGGSFVTLPALIGAGIPSVQANASSTVALLPGGLASAWTYHVRLGLGLRGRYGAGCWRRRWRAGWRAAFCCSGRPPPPST